MPPILRSDIWFIDKFEVGPFGFSDAHIQHLCSPNISKFDKPIDKVRVPWLYWTSEVYGIGKGIRSYCGWPCWLPIPAYSDHSLTWSSTIEPHECINPSSIYITWFDQRESAIREELNKRVVKIPFPWIPYRHKCNYAVKEDAKGTLVFYPHTNEGIILENFDEEKYFSDLLALPPIYHPISLCVHMQDINKGLHLKLRKYGLPVFTVGSNGSNFFVDRFYDLLSNFLYATSPKGGSEIFICHEFGIKYFIYGERPKKVNVSHKQIPIGEMNYPHDPLYVSVEHAIGTYFSGADSLLVAECNILSNSVLGISGRNLTPKQLFVLLSLSFIREVPRYLAIVLRLALKRFRAFVSDT